MRVYKLINLVLLNLLFASLVAAGIALHCRTFEPASFVACEAAYRYNAAVVGWTLALAVGSSVYSILIERLLSCSCFTCCCQEHGSFVHMAQAGGALMSAMMALLSVGWCGFGIYILTTAGGVSLTVFLSSWGVSLLLSELIGWGLSTAYFYWAYRREALAEAATTAGESEEHGAPPASNYTAL